MRKNPGRIDFSKNFNKQLRKAPLHIKIAFREKFQIFTKDPFNVRLNNHSLSGKLKGLHSININGDWRAIYSIETNETIVFELLGTHSQLYG